MKKLKNKIRLAALLVCAAVLGFSAHQARAGTTFTATASFNTTNNLTSGVGYTNSPTNATGIATGNAVDLDGYKTCGFYFHANVSNNAAAKVFVALVRNRNSAQSSLGTTNWETTSVYGAFISVPAMTNSFDWLTNLPEDFAGCANTAGILTITNSFASGQLATNVDFGLLKKQVPTKF